MEKTDFPGGLELIRRKGVGGREARLYRASVQRSNLSGTNELRNLLLRRLFRQFGQKLGSCRQHPT